MHEIFISYSSRHRDLTEELAAVLRHQYGPESVWWDQELEARGLFSEQIQAKLDGARVVVVIWTVDAAVSQWVYAEAARASQQRKLVNVRPEDTRAADVPMPFNIHQLAPIEDRQRIHGAVDGAWHGRPIPTTLPLFLFYEQQHNRRLIDPKQERLSSNAGPVALLQAKYAIVPYVDMSGMTATLVAWCAENSRPTAGRLVHGPGGLGKTRLMIDVAAKLRDARWIAGFLDPADGLDEIARQQRWQALEQLIDHGDDSGLLIVLDYAEGRQEEVANLARRLAERPASATRPIRLVLLTRSAGDWWERLLEERLELDALVRDVDRKPLVTEMPAITHAEHRRNLFATARNRFASVLRERGYKVRDCDPPPQRLQRLLTSREFERPLAVQIEALLWVTSTAPEAGATNVPELLGRVLGLERRHWRSLIVGLEPNPVRLNRAIAQVTLVQGTSTREATERLIMFDNYYGGSDKSRAGISSVINQLELLYSNQHATLPLAPDLVGEHLVATVVDADLIDGCCQWIANQPIDSSRNLLQHLLSVLQRAASNEHGQHARRQVEIVLDHMIVTYGVHHAKEILEVAAETEGPLVERLEISLRSLDDQLLEAFNSNVPVQSLVLVDFSLRIAEKMVEAARGVLEQASRNVNDSAAQNIALFQLGESLIRLSGRLYDVGDRYHSMDAIGEASGIFMHLRDRYEENLSAPLLFALALALSNASVLLSKLDATHDSMWSGEMGARILADLNAVDNRYLPYLARILVNLGNLYAEVASYGQAIDVTIQAMKAYRYLIKQHPLGYQPGFARALSSFAKRLAEKRRFGSALRASHCALELYTDIGSKKPDAFLPGWADCLDNHANRLCDSERWPEAHRAAVQSVELYRRLAARRANAYSPDLARSYRTLARIYNTQKEYALAVENVRKGIDVLLPLLESFPRAFKKQATDLRKDLCGYSERASVLLDGEALERLDQAIAKASPA